LYYTDDGKPHLNDGRKITISHSFDYSAIAISKSEIGIDIEKIETKYNVLPQNLLGQKIIFYVMRI
jgi:phosphopantetheinyl transferase